jgi:flagellin-like hook-associated protein FlgL
LARSQNQLQQSLTRLSTGLRINSGKDDPAGLIASEVLRSDITSTNKAITNSQRANQMIATADSSLGQISSLLNDIRGLVSEAANTGAMSAEQIAANQLQVDSSLEAIDRIAQVTQFQGKRLLDGNLDFTTVGVSNTQITDLQIDQANFGTLRQIGVTVDVVAQAEKATLQYNNATVTNDVVLEVGGSKGYEAFRFASGSTVTDMAAAINLVSDALGVEASTSAITTTAAAKGTATVQGASSSSLAITADTAGRTAGNIAIKFSLNTSDALAVVDPTGGDPNVIEVKLANQQWKAGTAQAIAVGATAETASIQSTVHGDWLNGLKLTTSVGGGVKAGEVSFDYSTKTISFTGTALSDMNDLETAIESKFGGLFSVSVSGNEVIKAVTDQAAFSAGGTNGGVLTDASNGVDDIATAFDGNASIKAAIDYTATGTGAVKYITHQATFGSANANLASDLNNGIQLTATDNAANLPITFSTSGVNQSLSISTNLNTTTNGYSTAYVQGKNANSTIKIAAINQGTSYDGITISYEQSTNDRSVLWNPEAKTLKVYNDYAAGTVKAEDVISQINTAMSTGGANLFTASAVGDATSDDGYVEANLTGTSSGGNKYSGITVNLGTDANGNITTTAAEVIAAINASATLQGEGISASNLGSSDGTGTMTTGTARFTEVGVTKSDGFATGVTVARGGTNAEMTITAKTAGAAYDGVKVVFHNDTTLTGGGDEYVRYDSSTKELGIYIKSGTSTANDVLNRFTSSTNPTDYALFSISRVGDGTGVLYSTDTGTLNGGLVDVGTASGGVALTGNYDVGDVVGTGLAISSTEYGSNQFVSVKTLSGTFQMYDTDNVAAERVSGVNANIRINGVQAVTDGLNASLNTSALDMSFTLSSSVAVDAKLTFSITGGGAQFQLGPDVVSNQQARMGITSVSTAKLGGTAGRLYELRSGGAKALNTDVLGAASVVEEVITQITNLRGRLGAFQKTTLDSNISSLSDTLESLTAAESDIRDADFAAESANMTRGQILVQSGLSVLGIANQNPQQVLSLLR